MSYIGRDKCGCIVAWTADIPANKGDTAREVARWIREGLTVEQVEVGQARGLPFGHRCKRNERVVQAPLLEEVVG